MAEFGGRDDDLPMGVNHVGLPAPPAELVGAGKCVVHSTKSVGDTHEEVVRAEFRRLRGGPSTDLLAPDDLGERGAEIGSDFPMA
jgi:hypothetical protein